jgi:hypothetical protein
MHRPIWRRFKPSVATHYPSTVALYKRAQAIVDAVPVERRRMWQAHDFSLLDEPIKRLSSSSQVEELLAALVLQAPRASVAQRRMDDHPHGFHDKQARLYELIAFNDTYVSTILLLEDSFYGTVNDQMKFMMDRFCKKVKAPTFSNKQWEAITHGLSREIAVFLAAKELGYQARMTSRQEDAMGVDMVITDVKRNHSMNLDIKTRSSFHFRLKDLASEGRISEAQREAGEHAGFCMVVNGHGDEEVHTTLLRIDEETYGQVQHFRIDRVDMLRDKLLTIMSY